MKKKLKALLIGFGQKGKLVFSLLLGHESLSITHVLCANHNKLPKNDLALIEEHGQVSVTCLTTLSSILNQHPVDVVIVASHANRYIDLIKLSIENKTAVITDKSLGFNSGELKMLAKDIKATNAPFMILLPHRFDQEVRSLKEKLFQGDIGTPHIIKITNRLPNIDPKPNTTNAQFYKQINRDEIDLIHFICGEKIKKISTSPFKDPNTNQDESLKLSNPMLSMTLHNGVIAIIDYIQSSTLDFEQRIEVFGERGVLRCDNLSEAKLHMLMSLNEPQSLPYWNFIERFKQAYLQALNHFLTGIKHNKPLSTNIDELITANTILKHLESTVLEKVTL